MRDGCIRKGHSQANSSRNRRETMQRLSMTFTANGKMKLLPSLFSCVYSTVKFFVFAMNSRRRCSISVCFINGDRRKELKISSYLCRLASAVSVMNNLSNVGINCMYPVADCKSLRHYHASTYTNCFDLSHSFW